MEQKILFSEKGTRGRKRGVKLRELSVLEKEKIYRQHSGLIVSIAKKYVGISPNLTFEDLIQEGIFGLFRAAEKFGGQKGCRFSTYAYWWIQQTINRALTKKGKTIRIPVNVIEKLNKYKAAKKNLLQELERDPFIEEIAEAMKMEVKKVQRIGRSLQNFPVILSLEGLAEENREEGSFLQFIEDEKTPSPMILASKNVLIEEIKKDLNAILTPREQKIIELRFGLKDDIPRTLEETGREMGLTRERIRQIIKKALERIRKYEVRKLAKLTKLKNKK